MLIDIARAAVNIATRARAGLDLADKASVEAFLKDVAPDVAVVVSSIAEMVKVGRVIITDEELRQVRSELENSSLPPEVVEAIVVLVLFILKRLLKR